MALGRKTGGGSRRGRPNRVTADVKALAQQHTPAAVQELARLALHAQSEQARVAAIKELLDRGHGRATQPVNMRVISSIEDLTDDELARIATVDALAPGAEPSRH